jgi:hypothetical protein
MSAFWPNADMHACRVHRPLSRVKADVTGLDEFMSTHPGRCYFNPLTVSTTASAPALRSTAIA